MEASARLSLARSPVATGPFDDFGIEAISVDLRESNSHPLTVEALAGDFAVLSLGRPFVDRGHVFHHAYQLLELDTDV